MIEDVRIALVSDDGATSDWYPSQVLLGSQHILLERRSADALRCDGIQAVICHSGDRATIEAVLHCGKRVALGTESIFTLAEDDAEVAEQHWLPAFLFRLAPEVAPAATILAGDSLGRPSVVEMESVVGSPALKGWEEDAPTAATYVEATLLGLDVLECLLGRRILATSGLAPRDGGKALWLHQFPDGIAVVHHVLPAALTPVPSFSCTISCDRGRLLLRREFAPGGLLVWSADRSTFDIPALKPLAPASGSASVKGGWEAAALLLALLGKSIPLPSSQDALRLARHVVATKRGTETQEEGVPRR